MLFHVRFERKRKADGADKNSICVYKAVEPLPHSITAMAFSQLLTVLVLIHNTGGEEHKHHLCQHETIILRGIICIHFVEVNLTALTSRV